MTVKVWRIVVEEFAAAAFEGHGASKFGGRWNSAGTRMVYTAESPSLAALELLVNVRSSGFMEESFVLIPAEFDDALLLALDPHNLPSNWKATPAPAALKHIGDTWAAAKSSLILKVPSAVVPEESNFLINPQHPDFSKIKIGKPRPFEYDARLAK